MNLSLSTIATTTFSNGDDVNGSLADDWENYKAYTRFYYITDEVFLYANPILIIVGKCFTLKRKYLIICSFFSILNNNIIAYTSCL
jgi:hypothetical protein